MSGVVHARQAVGARPQDRPRRRGRRGSRARARRRSPSRPCPATTSPPGCPTARGPPTRPSTARRAGARGARGCRSSWPRRVDLRAIASRSSVGLRMSRTCWSRAHSHEPDAPSAGSSAGREAGAGRASSDVAGADRRRPRRAPRRRVDRARVADAGAGGDDAVAQHAAGADLAPRRARRSARSSRPADRARRRRARPAGRRARPRRRGTPRSTKRRAGDRARRLARSARRRGSRAEALAHGGVDVALEDVEGALQVALGRADVQPVGVGGEAVEAVADEPRADLALDRDVAVRAAIRSSTERSST